MFTRFTVSFRLSVDCRGARGSAVGDEPEFLRLAVAVVEDAQGGVMPGATIVLVNTATNERREGVSGEDGTYRFVNLVPGTYRLEVELTGFQRYVRDQIEVNIQSTPRIAVTLQLGNLRKRSRSAVKRPCCRPRTLRSAPSSAVERCRSCRSTDATCSI